MTALESDCPKGNGCHRKTAIFSQRLQKKVAQHTRRCDNGTENCAASSHTNHLRGSRWVRSVVHMARTPLVMQSKLVYKSAFRRFSAKITHLSALQQNRYQNVCFQHKAESNYLSEHSTVADQIARISAFGKIFILRAIMPRVERHSRATSLQHGPMAS